MSTPRTPARGVLKGGFGGRPLPVLTDLVWPAIDFLCAAGSASMPRRIMLGLPWLSTCFRRARGELGVPSLLPCRGVLRPPDPMPPSVLMRMRPRAGPKSALLLTLGFVLGFLKERRPKLWRSCGGWVHRRMKGCHWSDNRLMKLIRGRAPKP